MTCHNCRFNRKWFCDNWQSDVKGCYMFPSKELDAITLERRWTSRLLQKVKFLREVDTATQESMSTQYLFWYWGKQDQLEFANKICEWLKSCGLNAFVEEDKHTKCYNVVFELKPKEDN